MIQYDDATNRRLGLSLREGEVKALVEQRGVGVEELNVAVGVGIGGAQVHLAFQVSTRLEVQGLPRLHLLLQQKAPVALLLDRSHRRIFNSNHLRAARRRRLISGDINIANGIHRNRIAFIIPVTRPVIALQPDHIPAAPILDGHNIIPGVYPRRVASHIDAVGLVNGN